jgi:hypothetical protein
MNDISVTLKGGSLYLACATCERFFAGLETIILLRREDDLLILPVRHAAAGGYLLKRRNGAGDRVVTAPDFFRENGIADGEERALPVAWSATFAALRSKDAFNRGKATLQT